MKIAALVGIVAIAAGSEAVANTIEEHQLMMVHAIKLRQFDRLKALLNTDYVIVNEPITRRKSQYRGRTYLGIAAQDCNVNAIDILLEGGADPEVIDEHYANEIRTPLSWALTHHFKGDCPHALRSLLSAGANPNRQFHWQNMVWRPLHYLAYDCKHPGHHFRVRTLRDHGGDVNALLDWKSTIYIEYTEQDTALHVLATVFPNEECYSVARELSRPDLESSPKPNFEFRNGRGARPSDLAAANCKARRTHYWEPVPAQFRKEILRVYESHGAPPPNAGSFCARN